MIINIRIVPPINSLLQPFDIPILIQQHHHPIHHIISIIAKRYYTEPSLITLYQTTQVVDPQQIIANMCFKDNDRLHVSVGYPAGRKSNGGLNVSDIQGLQFQEQDFCEIDENITKTTGPRTVKEQMKAQVKAQVSRKCDLDLYDDFDDFGGTDGGYYDGLMGDSGYWKDRGLGNKGNKKQTAYHDAGQYFANATMDRGSINKTKTFMMKFLGQYFDR